MAEAPLDRQDPAKKKKKDDEPQYICFGRPNKPLVVLLAYKIVFKNPEQTNAQPFMV